MFPILTASYSHALKTVFSTFYKLTIRPSKGFYIGSILLLPLLGLAHPQTTAPMQATARDDQSAISIYRAFYHDPRIVSAYTDVNVTNGVATLTGTVASEEARRLAAELAAKTEGITQVVNQLVVVLPAPAHSDQDIYRNVRHAISTDPQVNHYHINVGVLNGTVYLAGPVDTVFARAKIANLAAAVPGVAHIANALKVPQGANLYNPREVVGGAYPDGKNLGTPTKADEFPQPAAGAPPIESTAIANP